MRERLTDRGRYVMSLADAEARRLNHEFIGTEHLLLALAEAGALDALGIDAASVRDAVERAVEPGEESEHGELARSQRAQQAVDYAVEEALGLNQFKVCADHLLLGVVRVESGLGAHVLRDLGITIETARARILQELVRASEPSDD